MSLAQPRRVARSHARCVLFIAALWVALAAGSIAQPTTTSLPATTVAEIDRTVTAFMTKVQAPGLSLAVGLDGALRFEKGYGFADLEHRVPATPSTVYRLASVSKPITAVATMQLVDRGRLALDDTVDKWLPEMPPALRPITVRQLLSHQSGIRHYTTEEDDSTQAYAKHYDSLRESLGIFAGDPLVHAPGARMTYSTYAYTLLGVVIEKASGQGYVETVKQHVLVPAHMVDTRPDDVLSIVPNRAAGYATSPHRRAAEGRLHGSELQDARRRLALHRQ